MPRNVFISLFFCVSAHCVVWVGEGERGKLLYRLLVATHSSDFLHSSLTHDRRRQCLSNIQCFILGSYNSVIGFHIQGVQEKLCFSQFTAIPPSPTLLEETFKALNAMRVYSHSYWLVFYVQPIAAECWRGRGGKLSRILGKKHNI